MVTDSSRTTRPWRNTAELAQGRPTLVRPDHVTTVAIYRAREVTVLPTPRRPALADPDAGQSA